MGVRQWIINVLEAGRRKNEPERQTYSYPYGWGWLAGRNNKQSLPKMTPDNLRKLSESPIPRRAINVIKDEIAMLNWSVTSINEADQEKWQKLCDIVTNVLKKPNPSDSFRLWVEQIVEDFLVCSAGASEIVLSGDSMRPLRLYPVDAFSIQLFPEWDGAPDSHRYAQFANGKHIPLTDSEMMYVRMNPRTNTPFGYGFMETVWEQVNFFLNSNRSAGNQAGNSFIRKILNLGKGGTSAVDPYRAYWENEVKGRGVMPIIASEGAEVLDLGATDDKALFIEWQRFLIEVVAVCAGISPKKLGQTKDVNRSTADSEDEDTSKTIRSIADNLAEHINNEIVDGQFKFGHAIQFKFNYATSLKDQKTKADIDAIYLDRRVTTPDEVRDSLSKKALPNKHGEVLLMPSKTDVIDINKTADEQAQSTDPPPTPDPNNPSVKSRRMKASDNEPTDTDEAEQAFIAAYLLLMLSMLRRGENVSSVSALSFVWTPTEQDVKKLAEHLNDLKGGSWLQSYNRRRQEMNAETLGAVPSGTMNDIRSLADERSRLIMGTYAEEMKNKLNETEKRHSDLVGSEKENAIQKDMEEWMTARIAYKSAQISSYEAGESWNQGLFAHDKSHAPDTEYYVQPVATNHADCAEIIAGSPYTADTLPAELPLHPNCPHRYYAVVYG